MPSSPTTLPGLSLKAVNSGLHPSQKWLAAFDTITYIVCGQGSIDKVNHIGQSPASLIGCVFKPAWLKLSVYFYLQMWVCNSNLSWQITVITIEAAPLSLRRFVVPFGAQLNERVVQLKCDAHANSHRLTVHEFPGGARSVYNVFGNQSPDSFQLPSLPVVPLAHLTSLFDVTF